MGVWKRWVGSRYKWLERRVPSTAIVIWCDGRVHHCPGACTCVPHSGRRYSANASHLLHCKTLGEARSVLFSFSPLTAVTTRPGRDCRKVSDYSYNNDDFVFRDQVNPWPEFRAKEPIKFPDATSRSHGPRPSRQAPKRAAKPRCNLAQRPPAREHHEPNSCRRAIAQPLAVDRYT